MKLRNAARLCASTAGAVLAAAVLHPSPAAAAGEPNIIVIVADDLGAEQTSLYGRPGAITTPNLQTLGTSGVRATQGYTAAAVCSPSRSAILTGQEPARVGADSNHLTRARAERLPTRTFAKDLPTQYKTMAIGKWDVAGASPYEAEHLPAEMGFDGFYGFFGGLHSYCAPAGNLKEYQPGTGTYANRTSTVYLTHEFTNRTVSYINDNAPGSGANPFLLYVAYNAPHVPLETPTSCNEGIQSDQDRFAEMVTVMDNGIGQIRQALQANGITSNTMVVFVSDNGPQSAYFTGPSRGGKYSLFEGGINVPFTLSWPAVLPAGGNYSQPVSTLDLYPTIMAASGSSAIPAPDMAGVNLIPYLTGQQTGPPHAQLSWRYVSDEHAEGEQGKVIVAQRSGNLKWIRSTTPATGTAPVAVTNYLFDLSISPGEADSQNLWPNAALSGPLTSAHHTWNTGNPLNESFNNPRPADDIRAGKPDGYIGAGGTWIVVPEGIENSYQGTASGFAGRAILEGSFYRDAKITSSLTLQDPGQAGVIVRGSGAAEAFNGYVILLAIPQDGSACAGPAPQPGGGSARVLISKVSNGSGTQVSCKNLSLTLGTSYTLTVRAVASTLTVSIGGTQHLNWTDVSSPYTGGRTGLRVTAVATGQTARALFATHNAASCTGSCP